MSYKEQIFNILNIKPFEEFKIVSFKSIYRITPNLVLQYKKNHIWINSTVIKFINILNDNHQIYKYSPITKEEQIALDYAKACGCNWIVKDKGGTITAFVNKPEKGKNLWIATDNNTFSALNINIPISFLSWDDDEPYYINGFSGGV